MCPLCIISLISQVAELRHQLVLNREVPLQEERIRSQQLAEQVEVMEKVVSQKSHATAAVSGDPFVYE